MNNFQYEKSSKRGLKVRRLGGEKQEDSIKEMIEKGAYLTAPRRIGYGDTEVRVEGGEIVIQVGGNVAGKVGGEGTLEWFGEAKIHGGLQGLGSRTEIWQKVVSTGDNLIELNAGVDGTSLKAPYSGIEVNRGDRPNAFLLYPEDTQRWTTVQEGRQRQIALHGDRLSDFEQDLTTDDIPEGKRRKYAKPTTSSHNFWVTGRVKKTQGTNREILPAFVPVSEEETKHLARCRATLGGGKASVQVIHNSTPVADPIDVQNSTVEQKLNVNLEDGDSIRIEVLDSNQGQNLSVSLTVVTKFT